LSWRVAILPYLDEQPLYSEFDLTKPWDDPHNLKLVARMPKVYMIPGFTAKEGMTHYRTLVGPGTALEPLKSPGGKLIGRNLLQFLDGTSNVIMAVEARDPTIWTKPDDLIYEPKGPLPKFGVVPAGFNAAFGDGTVRFIDAKTPEDVLRPYLTCNNGVSRQPLGDERDTGKPPKNFDDKKFFDKKTDKFDDKDKGSKDKDFDKTKDKDAEVKLTGKDAVAKTQIQTLTQASQAYFIKNQKWPQALSQLIERDDFGTLYLENRDALLDPWKKPYQYDLTGPKNKGRMPDIWTVTPTNEVIGNWSIEAPKK